MGGKPALPFQHHPLPIVSIFPVTFQCHCMLQLRTCQTLDSKKTAEMVSSVVGNNLLLNSTLLTQIEYCEAVQIISSPKTQNIKTKA